MSMKKNFTLKITAVLIAFLSLASIVQANTRWLTSSAVYNGTPKGYEIVGQGTYFKGTSGGTATVNTIADCHGSTACIVMGSSLFVFQSETDLNGLVLFGNSGTGSSRTFASVNTSATLNGTYTAVSTATASGAITGTHATVVCAPDSIIIEFGTTIAAGTFIRVNLSGNAYISAIELIAAGPSNKADITAFSLPTQLSSTITGSDIAVQVPNTTDVTALVPTITVSKSATVSPLSSVSQDFTNPFVYTVTAEDGVTTKQYTVTVTKVVPFPTIIAPADTTQTVKQGVAIDPIVFTATNAVSGSATGLPTGVDFDFGTLTISGIPTAPFGAYPYTVTLTGEVGAVPAIVTSTGTITVKDPTAKSILYLVKDAATVTSLPTIDNFYNALNLKYDVTARAAQANFTGNYDAYDLIVLQESLIGGDAATPNHELRLIKDVDKPILNTKSYFYTSTARWAWGKPDNGDTRAAVTVKQPTHPIFDGVSIVGDSAVLYNSYLFKNIQPTTIEGIGGVVIATTSHYANVAIHEVPAAIRLTSGTSKYLMVSIFQEQFDDLSANGLKLLDNAVTYLLGTTAFTPVLNSAATLSSLSISAGSLTPAFNPAVTMYTTDLALGVTTYPTVTALSTNANIGTITYSPATAPGSITIPVIAEDGTTNNYVISVTATDINEATLSSKVYAAANTIVVEGQVGELVTVMNLAGTVLYKNTITTSPETLNIVLDKGLYLVFINGVSTKVLIK